jgi:hypothetical protein
LAREDGKTNLVSTYFCLENGERPITGCGSMGQVVNIQPAMADFEKRK